MFINMVDHLLLVLGFFVGFFLPGFLIIEHFFRYLPRIYRLFLYVIVSVLTSTFTVYLCSLFIGYSRNSILIAYTPYIIWLIIFLFKKKYKNISLNKKHLAAYFLSILIYLVFVFVLSVSVFSIKNNVVIMAADNWQDTAMHLSIIESISQGNFPPQAPYFSGRPLSYYYFADFHSSIIETLYNRFFPRVIVYSNSFYASLIFLGIYALTYRITKSQITSLLSGIMAVFSGNLMFIRFFKDLSINDWYVSKIPTLLASRTYAAEYPAIMQVTPVTNYLLQNRPMAVALPVFIGILIFLISNRKKIFYRNFLMAGIMTSMLLYFQMFAFITCLVVIFLFICINFNTWDFKKLFKAVLFFFLPVLIVIFIKIVLNPGENEFVLKSFLGNFHLGPWDSIKSFSWYLIFSILNFGILIPTVLLSLIILFFQKRDDLFKPVLFICLFSLFIYLIPHFFTFTLYQIDMFKFFYFFAVISSVLYGYLFNKSKNIFIKLILVIFMVLSCLTSFLDLGSNIYNKNSGYNKAELDTGLWIRKYTDTNSIFITTDTIHSAVTDIGGRLRVSSYGLWPATHGFNLGDDNVDSRYKDIESFYNNPQNESIVSWVLSKYNVDYVYYGGSEKSKYPDFSRGIEKSSLLNKTYDQNNIQIYKRI